MFDPAAMRRIRESKDLSVSGLAQTMNVDRSLVSSWENGRRVPTVESATKVAAALRCSLDDLVTSAQQLVA